MMLIGSASMIFAGAAGASGALVLGLVYIMIAILYIFAAMFLWMYADRITRFLRKRSPGKLTAALEAQKSFWKFVGIVTLIVLCIYAVILLLAAFAWITTSM
jgi:hypothetical protein